MVWTDPRTWVASEVPDETIMNAHIRDNEHATQYRVGDLKNGISQAASDTDLNDVDDVFFAVGANERWYANCIVLHSTHTTPDLKLAFTWPSGTATITTVYSNAGGTVTQQTFTSSGTGLDFAGSSDFRVISLDGIFNIGGTGGVVRLQWAQNTSDANFTIVYYASHFEVCRLA